MRFLNKDVERRGDFTDAGEAELATRLQYRRANGKTVPDVQSELFEESQEYQEALLVGCSCLHILAAPRMQVPSAAFHPPAAYHPQSTVPRVAMMCVRHR